MNIQWTAPLSYALLLGLPILWVGVLAFLRRRKRIRHADVLLAWALLLALASVFALAAAMALLNRNTTTGLGLLTGIADDLTAAASPWMSGPAMVSAIVAFVTIWLVTRIAVLPWRTIEQVAKEHDDESDDTLPAPTRHRRRMRRALLVGLGGFAIAWLIPPIGAMTTGSPASVIATCWIPDRMLVAMASEDDLEALRNPLPND
ncbi:MAG: hypothetical protein ACTS3F_10810 [Phycisphaerales bacterium]